MSIKKIAAGVDVSGVLAPDYPMHMRKGQSIVIIVVVVHKNLPDLEIYRHLSDL